MARTLDQAKHTAKRNQILDAAYQLVYTKGFELMTIQDILTDLGISKGAFFHYFPSKRGLLEGLIERMLNEIEQVLTPIITDSHLSAVQKLERYFDVAQQWKSERKTILLGILRAWYQDENALLRQKMFAASTQRVSPHLAQIIRQGNQEGTWSCDYPNETAMMILYLLQGFSDSITEKLLSSTSQLDESWLTQSLQAYTSAVERVLGAAPHTLHILNTQDLAVWFDQNCSSTEPPRENSKASQTFQRQDELKEEEQL